MTVAVAVSGGVDSLLALLLLHEQGLAGMAVHATFLPPSPDQVRTTEGLAKTCARLGVSFHCLDLTEPFHRLVVRPFMTAYLEGATPNPCALCNRAIKFGLLLDKARSLGATSLATGHYARIEPDVADGPGLFRGTDPVKEQSYFLTLLSLHQLRTARFPLDGWTKAAVREEVRKRGFEVPAPHESQEVCFIPQGDYRAFLEGHCPDLPGSGPVTDTAGRVLGSHRGLWRHTLGQRRGLGIAHAEPLYVLDKRSETNTLMVGTGPELMADTVEVVRVNLLVPRQNWPETVLVQTVYRQAARPARVEELAGFLRVTFAAPRRKATPGQVAAVYSPEGRVLAGGIVRG